MLLAAGRMDNLKLQSSTKWLFVIAITKTVLILLLFLYSIFELVELNEKEKNYKKNFQYWEFEGLLSGAFVIVDTISAYICLLVIRRTTQYISFMRRKEFFEFRSSLEDSGEADRAI